jgi:hypothetical protein
VNIGLVLYPVGIIARASWLYVERVVDKAHQRISDALLKTPIMKDAVNGLHLNLEEKKCANITEK